MDFVNLDITFLVDKATKHMCWRVVTNALLFVYNSANMISAENN